MQLVVRRYRPSDRDSVCLLFSAGIKEHIGPCFFNAMSSPLYLLITAALCAAGYFIGSVFGAMVLPGLWMSIVYYCCYEIYADYVRNRLKTDMRDIPGSYMSRPGDCFWVAEAEAEGRPQILGMVAVVEKHNREERFGELFRMIISPSCRRRGLGLRLTQTVIDFCEEQGFSKVVLETSSTQRAAMALYNKLGFRLVNTHYTCESAQWLTRVTRVAFLKMEKTIKA